jgi:hypothetical protein
MATIELRLRGAIIIRNHKEVCPGRLVVRLHRDTDVGADLLLFMEDERWQHGETVYRLDRLSPNRENLCIMGPALDLRLSRLGHHKGEEECFPGWRNLLPESVLTVLQRTRWVSQAPVQPPARQRAQGLSSQH